MKSDNATRVRYPSAIIDIDSPTVYHLLAIELIVAGVKVLSSPTAPGNRSTTPRTTSDSAQEGIKMVGRIWRPTMDAFTGVSLYDQPLGNIKKQWMRLGRSLRVTSTEPVITPPLTWRHCHWSSCVCSFRVLGHPVRACKGCWRVHYCGRKCQKAYVVSLCFDVVSRLLIICV